MKTVTLRDLEHFGPRYESYEQWQAEEFFGRPFTPKPLWPFLGRAVSPVRLRSSNYALAQPPPLPDPPGGHDGGILPRSPF